MSIFYRLIEILVLIVLPLLVLFLRSNWSRKEININVTILPILWYIFYAPIHEFSHILGCFFVGAEIKDYRLFAHFWEGDFGFAFVDVKGGYDINYDSLLILIFPYILDLFSILIGYYILSKSQIKNSFLVGLTFLMFCLRPLYDIIDNYIGIFYNHSDLVLTSEIIGKFITYSYGIITTGIGLVIVLVLLKKYNHYPNIEKEIVV